MAVDIAARWHTEHSLVLPAELRGVVVAHGITNTGDVRWFGEEPRPSFVQADLRHAFSVCPQCRLSVDRQDLRSRRAVATIGVVAIGSRLVADGRTSIPYQIEASAFNELI
jgi:hypothetical protein